MRGKSSLLRGLHPVGFVLVVPKTIKRVNEFGAKCAITNNEEGANYAQVSYDRDEPNSTLILST